MTCLYIRRIALICFVTGVIPLLQAAENVSTSRVGVQELPAGQAQRSALLDAAGRTFILKQTPHFLIAHNVSDADIRPFVSRVEQTYLSILRFCESNEIAMRPPTRKLEIIYFDTAADYARYARRIRIPAEGTYGVYHELTNRSAFYNVATDPQLVQMREELQAARERAGVMEKTIAAAAGTSDRITLEYSDGRQKVLSVAQAKTELNQSRERIKTLDAQAVNYAERINRTVVQHETAHQVFFNIGVHVRGGTNPIWLVEGLAMLFETPPSSGGTGSGIGAVNQLRLLDFRSALTQGKPSRTVKMEDMLKVLRQGPLVPIQDFISQPGLFQIRGQEGSLRYAQAWALVHFLHRQRTAQFAAYVKCIAARPPDRRINTQDEIKDFETAFGPVSDELTRRWITYMTTIGLVSP